MDLICLLFFDCLIDYYVYRMSLQFARAQDNAFKCLVLSVQKRYSICYHARQIKAAILHYREAGTRKYVAILLQKLFK